MILRPEFVPGLLTGLSWAVSGCATTARLHSEAELAVVARACGLDKDHVAQFPEEPRLVFLQPVSAPGQLSCVRRWAEQRRLNLVYIDAPTAVSQ